MNNEDQCALSFNVLILIVLVSRVSEYWYHTNILTSLMRHMSYDITLVKKLERVLNYFKEQCKGKSFEGRDFSELRGLLVRLCRTSDEEFTIEVVFLFMYFLMLLNSFSGVAVTVKLSLHCRFSLC